MQKVKFEKLASEKSNPSVTISMNTHRTHPENLQDTVVLQKLCKDTEDKLISEFGKRPILPLLENLEEVSAETDSNFNLDSMHIFLSNDTKEIVKSACPALEDKVEISDSFSIDSLIRSATRDFEYLILLLSQDGARLFVAVNDVIVSEFENESFPFGGNTHFNTEPNRIYDPRSADNKVYEYFNTLDKEVVKVVNQTDLHCVVISTTQNYSQLMQVADKPSIYKGNTSIDFDKQSNVQIAEKAWEIMKEHSANLENAAIDEMKEASGQDKIMTDLFEIYLAIKEGRGDLLIIYKDDNEAVNDVSEPTPDSLNEITRHDVFDDITSGLAREMLSKKGRVVFTNQSEIKVFGEIVLKIYN